jgi:4-hydroxybenzoate polyprenyltransferase
MSISMPDRAYMYRLNLFLALSRTPHLLLDLAAPGLAAILYLHAFPPPAILLVGIITAFAGYTAVYALNDVVDYHVDRELLGTAFAPVSQNDLDSFFVRHPLAQGMLSFRQGVIWTFAWAGLALAGSYFLNPFCIIIFGSAALLEIIYCKLLKITSLRSMVSGLVKTSGPVAAVFAVAPHPDVLFLTVLFLWLYLWEIGGQNIPNDWADLDTDRKINARTIPIQIGLRGSVIMILLSLLATSVMSLVMYLVSPEPLSAVYPAGAILSAVYFLLLPGYRLFLTRSPEDAAGLFNRSSYYPLSMFLVTMLSWMF